MRPGATGWDQARAIAASVRPLPPVTAGLDQALGAVLAGDLRAPAGLPATDTAAMDGFATCGPGPWRLAGHVLAGQVHDTALRDGEAVEIATGATVPPGADAVLRYEEAGRSPCGAVTGPGRPGRAGRDIRPAGSDFLAGQLLIASGTRLTALMLGLAASAGCDEVRVRPRPRVSVIITGSEVRARGVPSASVTRDALGPAMTGLVSSLGAGLSWVRRVGDTEESLARALAEAGPDVHVVTGGSSAGPTDRLHKVLADAGAELLVDGVRCRPGHPQLLAALPDGRRVVGLPGNPFAAVAGLVTLLAPLLTAWSGASQVADLVIRRPDDAPRRAGHTVLVPVHLDAGGRLRLLPASSPASLLTVSHATHLLATGDSDTAVLVPLPTGLTAATNVHCASLRSAGCHSARACRI
jgi:molybdopterin molybdotransferase